MGRGSKAKTKEEQGSLFDGLPIQKRDNGPGYTRLEVPLWTENKARLIAAYVKLFTMITRHGAYIDGFAGPQTLERVASEAAIEACAANLVLRNRPPWIRHFWLCDKDPAGVQALERIRKSSPYVAGRTVEVLKGDFNKKVSAILESGKITDSMATFCLLDQRTFECEWATVEKLARHKQNGRKIELFYFLGSGWLDRALIGTTRNTAKIDRWWGRSDWRQLLDMTKHERADLLGRRFQEELGYGWVQNWPIYKKEQEDSPVMFHMIHCSDHERATSLMNDAYREVARPPDKEQLLLI